LTLNEEELHDVLHSAVVAEQRGQHDVVAFGAVGEVEAVAEEAYDGRAAEVVDRRRNYELVVDEHGWHFGQGEGGGGEEGGGGGAVIGHVWLAGGDAGMRGAGCRGFEDCKGMQMAPARSSARCHVHGCRDVGVAEEARGCTYLAAAVESRVVLGWRGQREFRFYQDVFGSHLAHHAELFRGYLTKRVLIRFIYICEVPS
jgi:hypothetical protein